MEREKGRIEITVNKEGEIIGKIKFTNKKGKTKEIQLKDYAFILEKSYENKNIEMEREEGKIEKLFIDGKEIKKIEGVEEKINSREKHKKHKNEKTLIKNVEHKSFASEKIKEFLNPYNFVDVSGKTPRYPFKGNDNFHGNSGYINIEMEAITPLFIPDPEKTIEENEHKKMKFFRVNDKPYIPSTSLKGMFRNIVETISNSCFPHDYSKNKSLNYLSERLDVSKSNESRKVQNLSPGVLKNLSPGVLIKRGEKWSFIKLDEAKVLTVVDRIDEKKVYYAENTDKAIEKISVKTNNEKTSGIDKYIKAKKPRKFNLGKVNHIEKEPYKITKINDITLDKQINKYNKKFPYINLNDEKVIGKDNLVPLFYAIIRRKKIGNNRYIYKAKEVSDKIEDLKKRLDGYKSSENKKNDVTYAVCQVMLKTSFDIDTKTQDKLFFKFEKTDIREYINGNGGYDDIDEEIMNKFKNLISQRYENLKKDYSNDSLFNIQPENVVSGMLVFYSKNDKYLSYTQIPRIPFKYGIHDLVSKLDKSKCDKFEKLCPACNIFGATDIKDGNNKISIGGKISVSIGEISNYNFKKEVHLKPLSEPKPSFYPFYILENRKGTDGLGRSESYKSLGKIGRKIYLFHNNEKLDYSTNEQNKLNSTVELLNSGAKIKFSIRYFNLSNYELGLVLQALNMEYKSKKLDYQLGMGKPLGLGRVKINTIDVTEIDRKKRYSSLKETGENLMNEEKIKKFINLFKLIQKDTKNINIKFDNDGLNDKNIDDYNIKDVSDFDDLLYIKEYKLLRSINANDDFNELKNLWIKYPSRMDGGELKGFKWFMDEKSNQKQKQRLFKPDMIKNIDQNKENIPLFNWG